MQVLRSCMYSQGPVDGSAMIEIPIPWGFCFLYADMMPYNLSIQHNIKENLSDIYI